MPTALRSAILGAIQGATEFLPVSSSGHLVVLPALFGWPDQNLTFDAALHWATALAVLLYFRDDWLKLASGGLRYVVRRDEGRDEAVTLAMIALATLPAALVGLALEDHVELLFSSPTAAAFMLYVTAGLLVLAEARYHGSPAAPRSLSWRAALVIGLAQAVAIVPGISRSGATIAAGLLVGLDRREATRFSFLMAAPIILGAGFLKLGDFATSSPSLGDVRSLGLGVLVSFAVGYLSIGWLLRHVRTRSLLPFAAYVAGLGTLALVVLALS